MVDQKSSGKTSSKALRPVLGLWPSHFWGFETVELLREEDGRLTPNPQCGRTGYPTLFDMGALPAARLPSAEASSKSHKHK